MPFLQGQPWEGYQGSHILIYDYINDKVEDKGIPVPFESIYGETAEKLRRKGLLAEEDGRWSLTERGVDISNTVMAEFLLDA